MKQARSFKWALCGVCGASIVANTRCDVCPKPEAAQPMSWREAVKMGWTWEKWDAHWERKSKAVQS